MTPARGRENMFDRGMLQQQQQRLQVLPHAFGRVAPVKLCVSICDIKRVVEREREAIQTNPSCYVYQVIANARVVSHAKL